MLHDFFLTTKIGFALVLAVFLLRCMHPARRSNFIQLQCLDKPPALALPLPASALKSFR